MDPLITPQKNVVPLPTALPEVFFDSEELKDLARKNQTRLVHIETAVVSQADMQVHQIAQINELQGTVFELSRTVAQMSRLLRMVGDLAGDTPMPPELDPPN